MRLKGRALLFACLLFLLMSSCQAEERKDEWKKTDFNFSKFKTIVVVTSIDPKAQLDKFDMRKLEEFYSNVFIQDKEKWSQSNYRFIMLNQLKDANMPQVGIVDARQYKSEIEKVTPISVDAILFIKVTSFGYDQRFVPETSYTYTEDVEKEIDTSYQDSQGKWIHSKKTIKIPVERTQITPAHYDTYSNAGMDYTLIDTVTNETVWMLLDIREALGKNPLDMTGRIINRAADCLLKLNS